MHSFRWDNCAQRDNFHLCQQNSFVSKALRNSPRLLQPLPRGGLDCLTVQGFKPHVLSSKPQLPPGLFLTPSFFFLTRARLLHSCFASLHLGHFVLTSEDSPAGKGCGAVARRVFTSWCSEHPLWWPNLLLIWESRLLKDLEWWKGAMGSLQQLPFFLPSPEYEPFLQQCSISLPCNACVNQNCKHSSLIGTKCTQLDKE